MTVEGTDPGGGREMPRPSSQSATALGASPLCRPWRVRVVAIVGSVFVFAASWWWLERATARVPDFDQRVFLTINTWPDGLGPLLFPVMQLGNFWVCVVGPLVVVAIWRRPAPAITVGLATWAAYVSAKAVKDIVLRARPKGFLPDTVLRDGEITGYGFVSGHAAVAFAFATAITPWLGRRWLVAIAYGLATLVAIARVFVGAHLPLDVIGGAAVGVLCGVGAQLIVGVPGRDGRATDGSSGPVLRARVTR